MRKLRFFAFLRQTDRQTVGQADGHHRCVASCSLINTCPPNPENSYTMQYQSENDDVTQVFIDTLEEDVKEIFQPVQVPHKVIFTERDKKFMLRLLLVISVAKNQVKIKFGIIVILVVNLGALIIING